MAAAADLSGALARTIQFLRAERGWSLDQLAARSGVSKGVLVALEQSRSNPNLGTLARISDAFGVPVTRLVDVPDEPSVRITGPAESRVLWHGPLGGPGTIIAATDPPWAAELWRFSPLPRERGGRGRPGPPLAVQPSTRPPLASPPPGHTQAHPRLRAGDAAVGVERPRLIRSAVTAPDLDIRSGGCLVVECVQALGAAVHRQLVGGGGC